MKLTPNINISLGSPVWRMRIDEDAAILCLETRDLETKETSFWSVNLGDGTVNFSNLQLPYGWQCGLDETVHGVMLVHGYQSDLLPVRKGLTAIDLQTGKVLWENHNLNTEGANTVGFDVYDARIQPKKIFTIDGRTQRRLSTAHTGQPLFSQVQYPLEPNDNAVRSFAAVRRVNGHEALFLNHNQYRILSLHALNNGHVNQYLYILDNDENVVFEDIIAQNIQKLQPEAFIVFKQNLIWLQNRSVIKVLHL